MSDDNDRASLIAAAKGYEADGEKYPGGYGWLIKRLAAALIQSERELTELGTAFRDYKIVHPEGTR